MKDETRTPEAGGQNEPGEPSRASGWMVQILPVLAAIAMTGFWLDHDRMRSLGGAMASLGDSGIAWADGGSPGPRLSAEQRFLLEGDLSRGEQWQQKRAIWEAHPDNPVYLGNYLSALAAGPGQDTNKLDACRKELAAAREVDPENARLDYLEAAWMLRLAAQVKETTTRSGEEGEKRTEYALEVGDRARLDEAMALLIQGTKKPHMRRYSAEMLKVQFEVLGPPRNLLQLVHRVSVAAGTLLPDLAEYRRLSRTSRLYAGLLVSEGKSDAAVPFLEAWRPLTVHLAEDSFTLIDVLVVGALAKDAAEGVPVVYRGMGREEDAQRVAAQAAALAKPVADWRAQREAADKEHGAEAETLRERGSVLVGMLLPALGVWPDEADYRPARMLEYTAAAQGLLGALCVALLAGILVCLGLSLRWQLLASEPGSRPLTLIPDLGTLGRILILGVVVPWVAFLLITRNVPLSGHAYSALVGAHKLIAEGGLLLAALIVLPVVMAMAFVRRRCEAIGVATTRWYARGVKWPFAVGAVTLGLIWFCPATGSEAVLGIAWIALALMAVSLFIGILLTVAQGIGGGAAYGRFLGTTFRTLIPVLALVIVVLGVVARPYLAHAQARYLANDTLLFENERPGFTRLESDLTDRLKGEILAVAGSQQGQ